MWEREAFTSSQGIWKLACRSDNTTSVTHGMVLAFGGSLPDKAAESEEIWGC